MKKIALTMSVAASAIACPALAQDASAEVDAKEIIVTATLREADVQDIPMAVTAVAPEALARQGIADIRTLSSLSASFSRIPE